MEKNEIYLNRKLMFKNHFIPIISTVTMTLYPILFLYLTNIYEGKFKELVPYVILFVTLTFLLTIALGFILHNFIKSSICISILSILFFNYRFIEIGLQKVFDGFKYWHVIIILIILFFHLCYFLCKKLTGDTLYNITLLFLIFSVSLILFNFVLGIPKLINKFEKMKSIDKYDSMTTEEVKDYEDLPNIYFIIMDEQSSSNVIKKYYGYDDSDFYNKLEEMGFTVSHDSYNEAIATKIVTANLLAMEYKITDYTDDPGILNIRRDPYLFRFVKDQGYTIRGIDYGRQKSNIDVLPIDILMENSINLFSDTLDVLLLKNTPLYVYITERVDGEAEFIKSCYEYIIDDTVKGLKFGYYHFSGAHAPYIFDENGHINPPHLRTKFDSIDPYLGQFKYSQKRIIDAIYKVLEKDKNCVIILQSDHSARMGVDKKNWDRFGVEERDIRNVMNAVYYMGEPIEDIKGQSGLNTLRIIFNNIFNTNFPILEVPYVEVPVY